MTLSVYECWGLHFSKQHKITFLGTVLKLLLPPRRAFAHYYRSSTFSNLCWEQKKKNPISPTAYAEKLEVS